MLARFPEARLPEDAETRRYTLLERVGEGGFGVVYRARLDGPGGFSKQVAIKLLREVDLPDSVVRRFRDEARILGLLSDRAILGVDPPTRLDGRWALVMEYVDGASLARVLQDDGPLPPTVALEIVAEVARALDAAWHQASPDGHPLALVHRDLKPANLQITPSGQVKILDFGIARARFEAREAHTTTHLPGTPGYMAPERLAGVEGPAADVFSLGVVLYEAVTGTWPEVPAQPASDGDAAALDAALAISKAMRDPDPGARPSAREVEERCLAARAAQSGPTARQWAQGRVWRRAPMSDERVGSVLTRTIGTQAPPRPVPWRSIGVGAAMIGAIAVAAWTTTHPPDRPIPPLEEAVRQPFLDFVMDLDAAVSERTDLRAPATWDRALYDSVVAHLAEIDGDRASWRRIDQVWSTWGEVTDALRAAGLPEVAAGIPWVESRYTPELQSAFCAKGLWQFMPETAHRSGPVHGAPLRVADCRFEDDPSVSWTPTALAPPKPFPYVRDGRCRIPTRLGCAVDERTDVARSTAAAIAMLASAYDDPSLRASGAVVQATLATHFAGYDDARFDVPRASNVLPAYNAWARGVDESRHPGFFAAVKACGADPECTPDLDPHVVDYVGEAIAAHFAAVCYYAAEYPEHPPFAPWRKYADGYCRSVHVPSRAEVAVPDP